MVGKLERRRCTPDAHKRRGNCVDLESYLPVLLFLIVGAIIRVSRQSRSACCSSEPPDPEKLSPLRVRFRSVRRCANEVRRPVYW